MIKKLGSNNLKGGNIAKIKYFLPSGRNQNTDSKSLTKTKKGSSNQSFCTSKNQSKMASRRPSTSNNQQQQQEQPTSSQHELSFQIVGISEAPSSIQNYNVNVSEINVSQIKAAPYEYDWPSKSKNKNKVMPLTELLQNQYKNKLSRPQKIKINQVAKKEKFQSNFNIMSQQLSNRKLNAQEISHMVKQFSCQGEKQEFMKFVQQLKYDQNYQNTISMFTIMYFYQSKQKIRNKSSHR